MTRYFFLSFVILLFITPIFQGNFHVKILSFIIFVRKKLWILFGVDSTKPANGKEESPVDVKIER